MDSTPQYGGDGTVPDLNIGQVGSALDPDGHAKYNVTVRFGREDNKSVFNPIPEQAAVFENISGPEGRWYRWTGPLKIKTVLILYTIENLCSQLIDGHARSGGVVGAFSVGNIQATTLKNVWGNTLSTKSRIVEFTRDDSIHRLYGNATYAFITRLTVVFRTMP